MAIIKCKMCGGNLSIAETDKVVECEYCGTPQTVPNADNEKKMTLFNRANHLRLNNEFDKAAGVYEAIVADFPEEAEAYWGLILCKYGIEYVDDPADGRKVPTCHRTSFDSVMDDPNFELVMVYADPVARRVYREEAKQLEELRKGIIEVSGKEEPYDIFICYKETDENGDRTLDSVLAQDVYDMLTENGYRVFFSRVTLEDKLGQEYEPYIFAALNSAKIMLAIGTDYDYYNAVWVKNEWSRFLQLIAKGEKKTLIPCYKNLDAYDMPKEFAKLQAQDLGKVGAMQDLLRGIKKILPKVKGKEAVQPAVQQMMQQTIQIGSPNVIALLDRGNMALEDEQWNKAKEYFDQVLNMDAKNHDAYLGIVLANTGSRDLDAFVNAFIDHRIAESSELRRARSFADANQLAWWNKLDAEQKAADEKKAEIMHLALKKRKAEEKAERERKEAARKLEEDRKRKLEALALEEADKVIAAIQAKLSEKRPTLEAQLGSKKLRATELTQLCATYDGIQAQREGRKAWLEQYEQKKKHLQNRRSSLSIFASKEKKQIDSELAELERHAAQVSTEQLNLYKQLLGFETKAQAEQAKAKAETRVSELEQKILERRETQNDTYSFDTAVKVLSEKDQVREFVYQKGAVLLQNNPSIAFLIASAVKTVSSVSFGRYPQEQSATPISIEWEVLRREPDRILLFSKYALDCKPYNITKSSVTWESCSLRKWLNNEFLNTAFTMDEQKLIPTVTVSADMNPIYKPDPGRATQDKVFLLGATEVQNYLESDEERKCVPTDYAVSQGIRSIHSCSDDCDKLNGKDTCDWWVRSPGYRSNYASFVVSGRYGNILGGPVNLDRIAVRPALWVNLES